MENMKYNNMKEVTIKTQNNSNGLYWLMNKKRKIEKCKFSFFNHYLIDIANCSIHQIRNNFNDREHNL